eukprot:3436975-Prorocentrum_lima.AAC.1
MCQHAQSKSSCIGSLSSPSGLAVFALAQVELSTVREGPVNAWSPEEELLHIYFRFATCAHFLKILDVAPVKAP